MAPFLELALTLPLGAQTLQLELVTEARAIAVVGPSGSGKTTLLRALAGLERAAKGTLRLEGDRWLDSAAGIFVEPTLRRAGWVPQEGLLFPHLSVRENLAFAGPPASELEALAAALGLTALLERRPRNLSGGERQRVALGRAMLSRPRLLLLDEPFSAADAPLRATLTEVVADFARRTATPLVLVSHHPGDVAALATEVFTLREGRLVRGA